MLKFFVVAAEIVILIASLRSSFAQYLLEDVQRGATDLLTEISMKLDQAQLNSLRHALAPHMAGMREFQQDYLFEITSNKAQVEAFHERYCAQKNVNPYVNGANLIWVCQAIETTKLAEKVSHDD